MITKHITVNGIDGHQYQIGVTLLELDDLSTIRKKVLNTWYRDVKEDMDLQLGMVWPRTCAICGDPLGAAWDAHHAILSRGDVLRKYRPMIDNPLNILSVHNACHLSSPPTREFAWEFLCERYGKELVSLWYYDIMAPVFKSGEVPRRF